MEPSTLQTSPPTSWNWRTVCYVTLKREAGRWCNLGASYRISISTSLTWGFNNYLQFYTYKKHTMSDWGLFWLEEHIMSRCWRLQGLLAGVRSTNPETRSRMQRVHEAAWQPPSTGLLVLERAGLLSLTHYHLSEKRQEGQHRGTGLHFPSVAFIIKLCKTRFLNSEQSLDD